MPGTPEACSVVVADDSALMREGVVSLLRAAGLHVVGEATDGDALLRRVERARPDVVVVDIRMPPTQTDEGLVAAEQIRTSYPQVGVLVLSHHLEPHFALRLIEHSPQRTGYLIKDRVRDRGALVDAVRRVARGDCVVDESIVGELLRRDRPPGPFDELTAREREVLGLIAEGLSNRAICDRLDIGPRTLETHQHRVFEKLGILDSPDGNRRVLAVLTYLTASPG